MAKVVTTRAPLFDHLGYGTVGGMNDTEGGTALTCQRAQPSDRWIIGRDQGIEGFRD